MTIGTPVPWLVAMAKQQFGNLAVEIAEAMGYFRIFMCHLLGKLKLFELAYGGFHPTFPLVFGSPKRPVSFIAVDLA